MINNDAEALAYIDSSVREELALKFENLGEASITDKFGINHHSEHEKIVRAWAYSFEGLPQLSNPNEEWKNRKSRWLLSTGETLEATHAEVRNKIIADNPDFDASTEAEHKIIRDFLRDSKQSERKLTLLNQEELRKIPLGEKLSVDYFYVPEIFYEEEDDEEFRELYLTPLVFTAKDGTESERLYASKVPAGMTLWEAVRSDLKKDFNYPEGKSFRIERVTLLDTARNKHGQELTRVLIELVVDVPFKTEDLHPAGMTAKWKDEEEKQEAAPSREEVVAAIKEALKVIPSEEVKNQFAFEDYAYDEKIPEFKNAYDLYNEWKKAMDETIDFSDVSEASLEYRLSDHTIFLDAGLDTDQIELDEIANDWLMQDEDTARRQGFTDLADRIQSKINEINKRLNELSESN